MRMHENRYIDILLKLIYLVLIGGAVWLFFKYAFGWTIPLIIAYLLSRLILRHRPMHAVGGFRLLLAGVFPGL